MTDSNTRYLARVTYRIL